MKKIINSKLYNTETARKVAYACGGGQSFRDFHYWEETLYCKRTGEYFLHGEGGPMTKYAKQLEQNSWSGGEKIIPLAYKAAAEWAQEHMDADDYQAEFGEVAEDGTTVVLSVSMPAAAAERIKRAAREAGMSVSAYIADLVKGE